MKQLNLSAFNIRYIQYRQRLPKELQSEYADNIYVYIICLSTDMASEAPTKIGFSTCLLWIVILLYVLSVSV